MSARETLTADQRAALAEQLGDAQPARNSLLMSFGKSVQDRREHDHTTQREDWYCLNLAAYMGERAATVLRRLLDAEARTQRYRTAWGLASTRARSLAGAADRAAERARVGQQALQEALLTVLAMQMDQTAQRVADLRKAADDINGMPQDYECDPGRGDSAEFLRRRADEMEQGKDTSDAPQLSAGESTQALNNLLAHTTVFEIPWARSALPLQLRRSYGYADRWAICDREGHRWHREHGWVAEDDGIRYEAQRDATRYALAEAWPLAHQIATSESARATQTDGASQ
ncbi:hypothetical protein ABZT17_26950 [Streptomyces sp. NPDC005648]|uniref:hypothetical protein n=1 Tax=Streptomyces sp. NPDC005648 TaxID=3157044 RepID=UPI0033B0A9D2